VSKTRKSQSTGLNDLPLFQYSTKRKLERLGVVDVGSNSVRLVVFDGAARSPAYFFNEKILCGLGEGVAETGRLNPAGRERAIVAIRRFVALAKGMDAEPLYAVATAAVREAMDGADFIAEVKKRTGLHLLLASGEEEARLSAQGVLLGWPTARGLMCDIGGSSMELAEISDGEIGHCVSSALGPLKLASFGDGPELDAEIAHRVQRLRKGFSEDFETMFLVGGSWRAIARLDMARRKYPLKVLHEYKMSPSEVLETTGWIHTQDPADMRSLIGTSQERMRLVPTAARILERLIETFAPREIAVSSYGIREGLLYEQMPKSLRKRDPLIEACLNMERASARRPGFGKVLNEFLKPVFQRETKERKRLIRAACLLHDVTWRAHPDYRAEVCFDNATRANLGGLDHAGRAFLGTALLHRYKNSGAGTVLDDVGRMLTPEEMQLARIVGKAMRFGAMFAGASEKMSCELKVHRRRKVLELILHKGGEALFGEVVRTRFESLAVALEMETLITTG